MSRIPISLELYSVRKSLAADLEGTLQKVKAMGYDGVEFAGSLCYPAHRVKKAVEDAGLVITGWHISENVLKGDNFYATVAYHQAVGNKSVIIPSIPAEDYASYEAIKATAERMNTYVEKLAAEGMRTGYHNHNQEFKPLPDAPDKTAWTAIRELTDPRFVMQIDTGNALSGNADVNKEVLAAAGRSQIAHLKPYSLEKGYATLIGADTDDIDYKTILPFLLKEGKTEILVIEYECEELYSDLEGVKLCYEGLVGKYSDLLNL